MSTLAARLWQIAVLAGLLLLWALAARRNPTLSDVLGSPSQVAERLWALAASGEIFHHLAITSLEALLGFVAGSLLGAATAFLLAFIPFLRRLLDPLIGVFAVVPRIVLAPIFMVWFGLGILSKAALVTVVVFFIVYFNVDAGLRNISAVLIDRARVMGANTLGLVREIYVPASIVWILSGLRISVGFAFLGAIVAEYLGSNAGLGSLIATAQALNDPNAVMAGLLVILLTVTPLDRVLMRVEKHAMAWRG
jgi:NitT/TauT family transport system permease protein